MALRGGRFCPPKRRRATVPRRPILVEDEGLPEQVADQAKADDLAGKLEASDGMACLRRPPSLARPRRLVVVGQTAMPAHVQRLACKRRMNPHTLLHSAVRRHQFGRGPAAVVDTDEVLSGARPPQRTSDAGH
jgi:hypothetical protein